MRFYLITHFLFHLDGFYLCCALGRCYSVSWVPPGLGLLFLLSARLVGGETGFLLSSFPVFYRVFFLWLVHVQCARRGLFSCWLRYVLVVRIRPPPPAFTLSPFPAWWDCFMLVLPLIHCPLVCSLRMSSYCVPLGRQSLGGFCLLLVGAAVPALTFVSIRLLLPFPLWGVRRSATGP